MAHEHRELGRWRIHVKAPGHLSRFGDVGGEPGAELGLGKRKAVEVPRDPHEKQILRGIDVLVEIQDIGVMRGQERGHGGHETGLIRTVDQQDGGGCHGAKILKLTAFLGIVSAYIKTDVCMRFRFLLFAPMLLLTALPLQAQNGKTMMQGFYWDVTPGGVWYDSLAYYAPLLKRVGFDAIWFPPPSKGGAGSFDVGYTPYDYYDLGEFDSAPGDMTSGFGNFIPTRYGTRAKLQAAIQAYKSRGMEVYVDVVLNVQEAASSRIRTDASTPAAPADPSFHPVAIPRIRHFR